MANEAVITQDLESLHFEGTIADEAVGTDVLKGTLMQMTNDNTLTASTGDNEFWGGILIAEKEGGDGLTRAAVNRHCVASLNLSGVATVGSPAKLGGANQVENADDASITGSSEVVGMFLKSGTASDTVAVLVGAY